VLGLLKAIRALTPSRKAVLLCFEPIGQPCHRRALARWLNDRCGLVVPELEPVARAAPASLADADKPLQLALPGA
jgi:hypothetical protein